ALLDDHVLTFHEPRLVEALAERRHETREWLSRCAAEKSDHRHRRLLRLRRKRQRRGRAAEQGDEVAPFHCPMPSRASDREDSTPRAGRLLHPSSWGVRDDRGHAAENFSKEVAQNRPPHFRASNLPHHQKSFLTKFP